MHSIAKSQATRRPSVLARLSAIAYNAALTLICSQVHKFDLLGEHLRKEKETAVSTNSAAAEQQGIVKAAAVLAIANVISRVLGMAREIVKANLFGASGLLSAFEIAAYVPMSLYELIIGGMVNSALVPVFSEYAAKERREALWELVSMVLTIAFVALTAVVILIELAAPFVADLVGADKFDNPLLRDISITLVRAAAPAILFLGIATVLSATLYALRRFALPAFMSAVFNGTIVVTALLNPDKIESLVYGMLLGATLQLILQWVGLRDARLRWNLNWRHPAIRRILKLYAPIVAGLLVNQAMGVYSYRLATSVGDQSISYMKFATTLYQFPLGLVVTALSMATLPTLSRQAVDRLSAYRQTLADGIRLVITLILPATAGLFALALPIVILLFQRGRFTPEHSQITAQVLRVYLIGLPFAAVDQMLVFASYARKDTWRPAAVGVFSVGVYMITAVFLVNSIGLYSLMIADAVKHIVHTAVMLWLLRRHVGKLSGYGISRALLQSLAAATATGVTAFGAMGIITPLISEAVPSPFITHLLIVGAAGLVGLLTYGVMAYLLRISEIQLVWNMVKKRRTNKTA